MRIGGGIFKGRSINVPKTTLTRASTSYSRKVIFDTLSFYLQDAVTLDLFAGSGSLGIEALSRGGKSSVFVDNGIKAITTLKENIKTLDIKSQCKVIRKEAIKFIKTWNEGAFDIIFLDPPYSLPITELEQIFDIIYEKKFLSEEGVICLEIPTCKSCEIQESAGKAFNIFKEKRKGETVLLFLKK